MPLPVGGTLTKAGAPTSGVAQVETAVVAGTITLAGNATFTVTASGLAGSPLDVSVAVALNDTDAIVAGKARTALAANAAIAALFSVGGTTTSVALTKLSAAANDATLNIAYTNDTCTGLTPDASSNDTTAGVKGDYNGVHNGQYCVDTTNYSIYVNSGTNLVVTWTLL